jgi:hypothetical protein
MSKLQPFGKILLELRVFILLIDDERIFLVLYATNKQQQETKHKFLLAFGMKSIFF